MDRFTRYKNEYDEIIKAAPAGSFAVPFAVWAGAKWEEENNINPWDFDKYEKALAELEKNKEFALQECINEYLTIMINTLDDLQKGGKNKKGE